MVNDGFWAAAVFMVKKVNRKLLDGSLGFAAGIIIAASFWSLLAPAIEISGGKGIPTWVPAVVGFLMGGVFLGVIDKIIPHLHPGCPMKKLKELKRFGIETDYLYLL